MVRSLMKFLGLGLGLPETIYISLVPVQTQSLHIYLFILFKISSLQTYIVHTDCSLGIASMKLQAICIHLAQIEGKALKGHYTDLVAKHDLLQSLARPEESAL